MADGWDLHAVVSGCTAAAASSATVNVNFQTNSVEDPLPDLASLSFVNDDDDDTPFSHQGFGSKLDVNSDFEFQGLEEIYRSYNFLEPWPNNPSTSSISIAQRQRQSQPPPPPQKMELQLVTPQLIKNSRAGSSLSLPAIRSRRRKNQQTKLVHQMSHEELLADSWAWRKYGQKPIKGSPYPRNYYRCSTSKGCAARKQVEKSPSDPEIYVVSYTGEHTHPRPTHRNSLAGTTRAKFSSRPTAAGASSEPPSAVATIPNPPCSSSPPISTSSLSPSTPLIEGESITAPPENSLAKTIELLDDDEGLEMEETEYDEVVLIPNTILSEDMLKGFEELRKANSGSTQFDRTHDHNSLPPWNFSSASAGGGGC